MCMYLYNRETLAVWFVWIKAALRLGSKMICKRKKVFTVLHLFSHSNQCSLMLLFDQMIFLFTCPSVHLSLHHYRVLGYADRSSLICTVLYPCNKCQMGLHSKKQLCVEDTWTNLDTRSSIDPLACSSPKLNLCCTVVSCIAICHNLHSRCWEHLLPTLSKHEVLHKNKCTRPC